MASEGSPTLTSQGSRRKSGDGSVQCVPTPGKPRHVLLASSKAAKKPDAVERNPWILVSTTGVQHMFDPPTPLSVCLLTMVRPLTHARASLLSAVIAFLAIYQNSLSFSSASLISLEVKWLALSILQSKNFIELFIC